MVGAGPYGLSVAAHLRHAGIAAHVFGEPMAFWRNNMPRGMLMRSPWRATHFSDPDGAWSLDAYAAAHGVDPNQRLPLDTFVAYGEWFQQHAVADVDRRAVRRIDAAGDGFRLTLGDGETLNASRVIIATGLRNQEYRPPAFKDVPATLASHTSAHPDLSVFRGKRVAVIGRGQSACETAALLAENGAEVEIITRGDIHWLGNSANGAARNTFRRRLREAMASPSEVGPFPLSWLVEIPGTVRHMPAAISRRVFAALPESGRLRMAQAALRQSPMQFRANDSGARARLATASRSISMPASACSIVFCSAPAIGSTSGGSASLGRNCLTGLSAPTVRHCCGRDSNRACRSCISSAPTRSRVSGRCLRFIAGAPYAARAVAQAMQGRMAQQPAGSAQGERVFGAVASPNVWTPQ